MGMNDAGLMVEKGTCGGEIFIPNVASGPNIAKALVAVSAEMPHVPLDATVRVRTRTGGEYSFKYATLGNIMSIVRPILAKYKLAILQKLEDGSLTTKIIHESGEYEQATVTLPFSDGMTVQERGSVITYLRRYQIVNMLNIVADEDDDANAADGNDIREKKTKGPVFHAPKQELPPELPDAPLPPEPDAAPKNEPPQKQKPLEQSPRQLLQKTIDGAMNNGYTAHVCDFMNGQYMEHGHDFAAFTDGECLQVIAAMKKTKWLKDVDFNKQKGTK